MAGPQDTPGSLQTPGEKRHWLDQLIFGGEAFRRFTQDSPVLPDVWIQFGMAHLESSVPERVDVLLVPHRDSSVGSLSLEVRKGLDHDHQNLSKQKKLPSADASIAYLQSAVAARLTFEELVGVILPLSEWWQTMIESLKTSNLAGLLAEKPSPKKVALLQDYLDQLGRQSNPNWPTQGTPQPIPANLQPFVWLVRVAGTLAFLKAHRATPKAGKTGITPPAPTAGIVAAFRKLIKKPAGKPVGTPCLFTVSLNRQVRNSMEKSVQTVKADAARLLFKIDARGLAWAVIDSGIDALHSVFQLTDKPTPGKTGAGGSRILETYDFTKIRELLADPGLELPQGEDADTDPVAEEYARRTLRRRLRSGRPMDWASLRHLLRIPHEKGYRPPANEHGTHVAGILGGVCPQIHLFDLRVLDEQGQGSEFSVLAALQFIRWLNEQHETPKIHGANLSLSIKHDVANYACGRTPVCEECERLVASGVVVVAAAGNAGFTRFSTPDGEAEGYRAISISDPGNTEAVITVGSTHRANPHSYGVSYFSSRGPTGDGRLKPDLVAPGEKITAPVPGGGWATKDGTSMAAPHVSGAAALLMARHRELIGKPRQIKDILCRTATDLGRESTFQGHGLVDILRALQSL